MENGLQIEAPASERLQKALASLLRALAFLLGCCGVSALLSALAQLLGAF